MTVPDHALGVALELARRIGAPPVSDDDARRAFFRQVAEQVAFERGPADRVGVKARFKGAPQCTDCIAWFEGAAMFAADLQNGKTGAIELVGISDVTGSEFLAVTPTDHLRRGVPAPGPAPAPLPLPAPPDAVLEQLLADVGRIANGLEGIADALLLIEGRLARVQTDGLKLRVR